MSELPEWTEAEEAWLDLDKRCERVLGLVRFVFFPNVPTFEKIAFSDEPRPKDYTIWHRIDAAEWRIIHEVLQVCALYREKHREEMNKPLTEQKECV